MMSAYRLCLLLAIGAILAVSASGASTGGAQSGLDVDAKNDAFKVWDAFKPLSRSKRGAFLGPVGMVIGNIILFGAKALTTLFDIIDTPLRWVNNMIASWANYLDNYTAGNPINYNRNSLFG